jgi:uncharacterized protein (TIGR02001 family)
MAWVALAVPHLVRAQESPVPTSPHTITGNLAIASDYRFRGISQTFGEGFRFGPAIQGGIDYSHASGLYLGNWDSNLSGNQYPNGSSIEMDLYGGYRRSFGDLGLDLGTIYYYYPGSELTGLATKSGGVTKQRLDTWEVYLSGSWKFFSLKYSYALTNYFGLSEDAVVALDNPKDSQGPLARNGSTKGTQYLLGSFSYPIAENLTLGANLGYTWVRHYGDLNYVDYKLGLTYDWNHWALGAALVGTNANTNFWYAASASGAIRRIGKPTVVLSVGRTF